MVAGSSLSSLQIYNATPFWLAEFLPRNLFDNLMGVPLYVIYCFSLVTFNILSLSLIFINLITMCLSVFLLGFILPGPLYASWALLAISFPVLGKFSVITTSNNSPGPVFSFWDPYNVNDAVFNIVPKVSRLCAFLFIFFYIPFWGHDFYSLSGHLSILLTQLFCN